MPVPEINTSNFSDDRINELPVNLQGTAGMPVSVSSPIGNEAAKFFEKIAANPDRQMVRTVPFSEIPTDGRYPVFMPDMDNEDIYGRTQSTADKWKNATIKFGGLAASTFVGNTVGLINGTKEWIETGKFTSFYDNDFTRQIEHFNSGLENIAPNYYTNEEQNNSLFTNLFTANFWADKIFKNAGFMAGMAASGGLTSMGLRATGKLVASAIPKGVKAIIGGEAATAAALTDDIVATVPQEKRLQALSHGFSEITKKGLQKTGNFIAKNDLLNKGHRALVSGLSSFGEASIEAVQTTTKLRNDLIKEYYNQYGQLPTGADLQAIEQDAAKAGNTVFGLNVALLTITNNIQLPKILGGSYNKGRKDFIGNIGKITTTGENFAVKEASKISTNLSRAKRIGSLLFSPSESFEELSQTSFQMGVEDYFKRTKDQKAKSDFEELASILYTGYKKGITSREGQEAALIGGISGGLFETIGSSVTTKDKKLSFQAPSPFREAQEKKQNTLDAVAQLNKTTFKSFLKDAKDSAVRAASIAKDQNKAIASGDKHLSRSLEADYLFNYAYPRIKYGKTELILEDIERYKQLASTPEGLEQLKNEGLIDPSDTSQQVLSRLSRLENMTKIADKRFDDLVNKYGTEKNKDGSQKYTDESIEAMLYTSFKVDDINARITELSGKIALVPSLNKLINEISTTGSISDKETLKQFREEIKNLPISGADKDALKQNIADLLSLYGERKAFAQLYEAAVKNPEVYNGITPDDFATVDNNLPDESTINIYPNLFSFENGKLSVLDGHRYSPTRNIFNEVVATDLKGNKKTFDVDNIPTTLALSQEAYEDIENQFSNALSDILPELGEDFKKLSLQEKIDRINQDPEVAEKVAQLLPSIIKNFKTKEQKEKQEKQLTDLQENFNKDNTSNSTEELSAEELKKTLKGEYKKHISQIGSSVTPTYDATPTKFVSENNFWSKRFTVFLHNLQEQKFNLNYSNLRVLPLTYETQQKYGLSIIPASYVAYDGTVVHNTGEKRDDARASIVMAVVHVDDNNNMQFVTTSGQLTTDPDPNHLAYSYMENANITGTGQFNQTEEKFTFESNPTSFIAAHENKRKQIFNNQDTNLYIFSVSNGVPFIKNWDETNRKSVLDSKLVKDQELDTPGIISIAFEKNKDGKTGKLTLPSGRTIDVPLGRPYLTLSNSVIALSSRKFSNKQAQTIADILIYRINELEEEFKTHQTISPNEKVDGFLRSILLYKNVQSPNAVYIDKATLHVGSTKFQLAAISKYRAQLVTALESIHPNVNTTRLNKQNTFEEIVGINPTTNTPIFREWKSYSRYLLDNKNPDKSKRESILSTKVIAPQKENSIQSDNNSFIYEEPPLIGYYVEINNWLTGQEIEQTAKEVKEEPKQQTIPEKQDDEETKLLTASLDMNGKTVLITYDRTNNTGKIDIGTEKIVPFTFTVDADGVIDNTSITAEGVNKQIVASGKSIFPKPKKQSASVDTSAETNTPTTIQPETETTTKEQAMQALEEAGRKNSAAYAELAASEQQPTPTNQAEIDAKKADIERRRQELEQRIKELKEDLKTATNIFDKADIKKKIERLQDESNSTPVFLSELNSEVASKTVSIKINGVTQTMFTSNQGVDRPQIFLNIEGKVIGFYRSSQGTDGKVKDNWYPFYGLAGGWVMKDGGGKNWRYNAFASPEMQTAIKEGAELLNTHYGQGKNIPNIPTLNFESSRDYNAQIGSPLIKLSDTKIIEIGDTLGKSNEYAQVLKEIAEEGFKPLDAELAALEQSIKTEQETSKEIPVKKGRAKGRLSNKKQEEDDEDDIAYRTITNNSVEIENHTEFKKWTEQNLPQITIAPLLANLIKKSNGSFAWGQYKDEVISLYEKAELGTGYHEAFHAVWRSLLSDFERENYEKQYRKINKISTETTSKEVEEMMAEEFRTYILNNKKPTTLLKRIFQAIKDMINWLLNNPDMSSLFRKINTGYFKNRPLKTARQFINQSAEREFEDPSLQRDLMEGITWVMMAQLFSSDIGLLQFVEGKESANVEVVYNKIYNYLNNFYEENEGKQAEIDKLILKGKFLEKLTIEQQEDILENILDEWDAIKDNWTAVKRQHLRYLKAHKIKIEDDGVYIDNQGENKNYREYDKDSFLLDAKDGAPTIVKLLFSTLAQVQDSPVANPDLKAKPYKRNSLGLPRLASFGQTFYKTMSELANTHGLLNMKEKLKKVAAYTPVLIPVVNRFFGQPNLNAWNKENWRLALSFEQVMSKQAPVFWIMFANENGNYIGDSNFNTQANLLIEEWMGNLRSSMPKFIAVEQNKLVFKPEYITSSISNDKSTYYKFLNEIQFPSDAITVEKIINSKDAQSFIKSVNTLYTSLTVKTNGKEVDMSSTKSESEIRTIAKLISKYSQTEVSAQHTSLEGNQLQKYVQHTAVSKKLDKLSEHNSIEELYNKFPQYKNDPYHNDSLLLQKIVSNNKPILGIIEGISGVNEYKITSDKMPYALRSLQEFNANLQGIFYMLVPADLKREWAIQTGDYFSMSDVIGDNRKEKLSKIFNTYLEKEMLLINDYNRRSFIEELSKTVENEKGEKVPTGQRLRHFKNILPSSLVEQAEAIAISGTKEQITEFIQKNSEKLYKAYTLFIEKESQKTQKEFEDADILKTINEQGAVQFQGLNTNYRKSNVFSPKTLKELMDYRTINYIISNIEMYKTFYGDPAQYKDDQKRVKNFHSGTESTHTGVESQFNRNATVIFNQYRNLQLLPEDVGYTDFSGGFNALTYDDGDTDNTKTISSNYQQYEEILEENAEPYKNLESADAQSFMLDITAREYVMKSSPHIWDEDRENNHQILMAKSRLAMEADGVYPGTYRPELKAQDKILAKQPTSFSLFVHKPIGVGTHSREDMFISNLLKTSTPTLYYYLIKDYPRLKELYLFMLKNKLGYVGPKSQQKIGKIKDAPKLYNPLNGNLDLSIKPEHIFRVGWEDFSKIVETSSKTKEQTRGSQPTKIIPYLNLFDNGTALTPEIEQKAEEYTKVMAESANFNYGLLLEELGITEENNTFKFSNPNKFTNWILKEIQKQDLPENVSSAIQTIYDEETDSYKLKYPLESIANYEALKSIIWSAADKVITRPKLNGGPKVQVSSQMWEKSKKEAIYLKDNVWTKVTKENLKEALASKSMRFTSSDLHFYTKEKPYMEVYLPNHMKKALKKVDPNMTDEELLQILQKDSKNNKLLKGIGFRIPTQGLNSIENIRIKGFLPEEYGDMIVVPSEITGKAGSDFDIDKLNLYLRNFYIDSKKQVQIVPFYGIGEEALDKFEVLASQIRQNNTKFDSLINLEKTDLEQDEELDKLENLSKKLYKQSLENYYIDLLEYFITIPENFVNLITPNSVKDMEELSEKITSLAQEKTESKGKKGLDYTQKLSPSYMASLRHRFQSSKDGVGIAATHQTSTAIRQRASTKLIFDENKITQEEKKIFSRYDDITDYYIRLKNNATNEDGTISLSNRKNIEGKSIADINSKMIDGQVDAANKPWAANMGINNDTLSLVLFLTSIGSSVEDVVLFINQPIIKRYLFLKNKHNALRIIDPTSPFYGEEQLYKDTTSLLGKVDKKWKSLQFTNEEMKNAITDWTRNDKNISKMLYESRQLQLHILDEFLKYQVYADHLFKFNQAINWDTTRFNSNHILNVKQGQFLTGENSMISSPAQALEKTFIQKAIKDPVIKTARSLAPVFVSQKPVFKQALVYINNLFTSDKIKISADDKIAILKRAEQQLIAYIVQIKTGINKEIYNNFISQNNVSGLLSQVKQSAKDDLKNNYALQTILPFVRNELFTTPKNIKLQTKPKGAVESNFFTDSFKQLKENPHTSALYEKLIKTGFLQSGVTPSQISFNQYIPFEDFATIIANSLTDITEADVINFTDAFFRNNWMNNTIVPKINKPNPVNGTNLISVQTTSKQANYPFLKSWSISGKDIKPLLFRRVIDPVTKQPVVQTQYTQGGNTINSYIYQPVNAWGDGNMLQEFYNTPQYSALPGHLKIEESIPDSIFAPGTKQFNENVSSESINLSDVKTTSTDVKQNVKTIGQYVKYQNEIYIVTKINNNGTIQIYNPTKEGIEAKKSVAERNLTSLDTKAIIVEYKDSEYIVTPKNTIISLTSNKIMNWNENDGNRKTILELANKQSENKDVEQNVKIFEQYKESIQLKDPGFTIEDWKRMPLEDQEKLIECL